MILVAVLMAVMICRVTQSSAKLRNDVSLSGLKSRTALQSPMRPSCTRSSDSPPARVRAGLHPHEPRVAADEHLPRAVVAVAHAHDELRDPRARASVSAPCEPRSASGCHALSPCRRGAPSPAPVERSLTLKLAQKIARSARSYKGICKCAGPKVFAAPQALERSPCLLVHAIPDTEELRFLVLGPLEVGEKAGRGPLLDLVARVPRSVGSEEIEADALLRRCSAGSRSSRASALVA